MTILQMIYELENFIAGEKASFFVALNCAEGKVGVVCLLVLYVLPLAVKILVAQVAKHRLSISAINKWWH